MTDVALFDAEPDTEQSTKQEANARADRIRNGMVAIVNLAEEVKAAWTSRDWQTLGYLSWDGYIHGEFGEHRLPMISRDQRRGLVTDMRSGGMSTRAIGAVLGVDPKTIVNDLRAVETSTPEVERNRRNLAALDAGLTIERVMGADGKSYPASRPTAPEVEPEPDVVDAEVIDDTTDADPWTDEERAMETIVRTGRAVVANMDGRHRHLIEWAKSVGLFTRIDEGEWANPFVIPDDGTPEQTVHNFGAYYMAFKPSLHRRLVFLAGHVLGCWCAPELCHGNHLRDLTPPMELS